MNTRICRIFLAAAGSAGTVFAQGSLTPPGAPGATMKTLAQVEPRTPITNIPYTITQPGSYYLTTNLTSAGSGVTIATNGVTLDLMGFTLAGNRSGGGNGIWLYHASGALPVQGVTVRNGAVNGFNYGIQAKFSQGARFEGLSISSNLNFGLKLDGLGGRCDGNAIVHCSFTGNGLAAVHLDGSSGQCNGNRIAHCSIGGNRDDGIGFYAASSGQCSGNLIYDCSIVGNGDVGISFNSGTGRCNGNRISRCAVNGNADYGIYLYGTSGQCSGNAISDCTVVGNVSYGIILNGNGGRCEGNAVVDCTIGDNAGTGIRLNSACGNRVENNHFFDFAGGTKYGIDSVSSTNNLIVRNASGGQLYDYSMGTKDVYGPVVTTVGELATNDVSAHPWANFSQ
ncbi:MAG: right-handed parallel beta-helix repeat-containing protein [Kiritimatiellia bacterium]